ncbi:MAG: LON peptidase substrate-binding domain-containing protein [Bacteroidetes bacterium]|nr:LON peptidase substrate-binding domain-containing protein [Bacteroidota bacterium]
MQASELTIPVFPLNMVLLPGETTKLYIFEKRYKQLVAECIENSAPFGISFYDKGKVNKFGCKVKIVKLLKNYQNGDIEILIECIDYFEMIEFIEVLSPKLYGAGRVKMLNNDALITNATLQDAVITYFFTTQNKLIGYEKVSNLTVYGVAASLNLTNQEKYALISSKNPQITLLNQLKLITEIINNEQNLKERFVNN